MTPAQNKDFVLKPITIERVAKQKFYWTKFKDFCETLKRPHDHFSEFLEAELGINTIMAEDKLGRR